MAVICPRVGFALPMRLRLSFPEPSLHPWEILPFLILTPEYQLFDSIPLKGFLV
jgi:hypothetical protein